MGLGTLHDPALDEFTFLAGIAAVDDGVGMLHEALYGVELFLIGRAADELDAEAVGDHGQVVEVPGPPPRGVVLWLFEGTKVAEGPGDLVAIAFHIAVVLDIGAQDARNVTANGWFFCDTDDHEKDRIFFYFRF